MFRNMFVSIFLFVSGIHVVLGGTCCKTGSNTYEWCSYYCCKKLSTWNLGTYTTYDTCCSSLSKSVSYNPADDTDCNGYFTSHVYVAVLIGLGSFASFIGFIVCCVCCVKACTANNRRAGTVVTNNGQPGVGMFMVSNNMAQQGQPQQPYPQPSQPGYPPQGYGQHGFNPGFQPTTSTGLQNPPPYSNPEFDKAAGPPIN